MTIVEPAYAKLNLSLEIVGRRPDGYHDLVTVFQTIDLADELTFDEANDLSLECEIPGLDDEENLALRAARLLRPRAQGQPGARIGLVKRIPLASGLGGGSADAAAALRGVTRLWRLRLTETELIELAAGLGADVPFLLRGGTALATGVGDRLEALPDIGERWAVLHLSEKAPADKTARAFRALATKPLADGRLTRDLASWIHAGAELHIEIMPNTFELVAADLYPSLGAARERMLRLGAPWVRLTGAGPTLFTLVESREMAQRIAAGLPGGTAWCVRTCPRLVDRS